MKAKSSYHRSENQYKFQTFSERLAAVNVDVARKVQKIAATPEEAETFFGEALEKWSELNCTQNFIDFRREIVNQIQSLAQLVHHKDAVVSALQRHLQVPKSLAYQPLLDLVVQLARDLQGDFYPYFESFFSIIVSLLNTHHHDVEVLEQAFSCLAYVFKFLWRTMLKDIKQVFSVFKPLLGKEHRHYINSFAAESFAFLIRKCKDHTELFRYIFEGLQGDPDQASGVGRLMFETVKGVQKQLHSGAHKLLPKLLGLLREPTLPQTEVGAALLEMWKCMAGYGAPESLQPAWEALLNELRQLHDGITKRKPSEVDQGAVLEVTSLLRCWLQHRSGILITPVEDLCQVLSLYFTGSRIPDQCTSAILDATADLLMASSCNIPLHLRPKLIKQVFQGDRPQSSLFDFTRRLFDLPLQQKDLLPELLGSCHRCLTGDQSKLGLVLQILCELVLHKCPPIMSGDQNIRIGTPLLDFTAVMKKNSKSGLPHLVQSILKKNSSQLASSTEDRTTLWAALVCLPHIRPLDEEILNKSLPKLARILMTGAEETTDSAGQLLCIWSEAILSLMRLQETNKVYDNVPIEDVVNIISKFPQNVDVLRASSVYLHNAANVAAAETVLDNQHLLSIFPHVQENLCQPYSQIRLLTLQICGEFQAVMPTLPDDMELDQVGVFAICLAAEKIEVHVQSYRDRLVHLRNLEWGIVQNQTPIGPFQQAALHYLLGTLYVNFTFLYEPVMEVMASHARNMDKKVFWDIYGRHLQEAAERAEKLLEKPKALELVTNSLRPAVEEPSSDHLDLLQLFESAYQHEAKFPDRPDHANYRCLLWKAMTFFPECAEPRSRIIVPLFFRFLDNEYYPADLSLAPSQDITKLEEEPQSEKMTEEEEEEQEESQGKDGPAKKQRRAPNKTFVTHLKLFSVFRKPTSLHGEPRLRALYHDLMFHRAIELQKVAFACLLTYGHKYLMPYRENFERLLDDKNFKNEIVLFSIDSEQTAIQKDHREHVLPILMRILYGKMQTKTGKDTSGRSNAHVRKNIVLRFLAGCEPEELNVFLDLVFEPFKPFISDNPKQRLEEIKESLDLSKVIPLRKQQSILSTMDIIQKKLSHLMEHYLPRLAQILICTLGVAAHLLEQRDQLRSHAVNSLKAIRQMSMTRLNKFMEGFPTFCWTRDYIDALFDAAVWPQLEKLPHEGIYSPTGLLNLLFTWTKYSHYMILLAKHGEGDPDLSPLRYVFELLHSPHVNPTVVKVILTLVDNLLDDEGEVPADEDLTDQVTPTVTFPRPDLSVGVNLLLSHVPRILDYLRKVVEKMDAAQGRLSTLPTQELTILAKLSEYVKDISQSGHIVSLLLPFLANNLHKSQDLEVSVLQAITNLLRRVDDPIQYLKPSTKLFSCITSRVSRAELCEALKVIGERDENAKPIVNVVTKLNTWDRRFVEEPDYMIRLEGYQEAQGLLAPEKEIDTTLMLMLVHNCCFVLNTTEDMSLRDSSSLCLESLVKRVGLEAENKELFQEVITRNLLPLVKDGIKHKQEVSRHEFIHLLGHLVTAFPNHPVFSCLGKLRDKHDPEVDFFDNITHIQLHRRGRAMKRLVKILSSDPLSNECLTQYLLPIITCFIRDEAYLKHSHIIDSAIEAVGAVCRVLPWPRYCGVLRHYLMLLPKSLSNQKAMVRLVVAILDSFHFDLRNSQEMSKLSLASQEDVSEKSKEDSEIAQPSTEETPMEEGEEMEKEEEMEEEEEDKSSDGFHMCSAGLATRIHNVILRNIIPQLHRCLTQKAKSDDEHKAAQVGKYAEDEEILRVPIAIAMVKLLQNMPRKSLQHSLPGVLLKVCTFLRSRAVDIRNTARDTLLKILQSLGATYFSFVLSEMRGNLKRGYQLHVLSYTVFFLLNSLSSLEPGDLDNCLPSLVQVFNEELFGHVSEEKEVDGITSKLFEARTSKSFESYGILGKYLTSASVGKVIVPLKEVLDTTHSHKVTRKVQEVLRRLSHGLVDNKGLGLEGLLTFTYGLVYEALPLLKNKKESDTSEPEADPRLQPPSSYLLKADVPRGGRKTKTHSKTNTYIIIEFGLQVLNLVLRRSLLAPHNMEHLQLLDPFVSALGVALKANNIKVTSTALRCLIWMFKFPLPQMKKQIAHVTKSLFVLLHNYASVGAGKGDNFELVVMCFKAMTVLVRDIQYHSINTKQLQVLLGYAEQDIHDYSRQATAFSLLKAILGRKLVVPEMQEVMNKVRQLSVTADSAHVRLQSRQVMLTFLLDYPLGAKLQSHLEFYLTQLDYEHETGRESALEMMATIFETFPQKLLLEYATFFFVPLASRLLNDESTKCRKLAALAVKSLLSKIDANHRDKLFSIAFQWFQESKVQIRHLGALALGLLVEVEGTKFENHLSILLPIIQHQTMPDKYDQGNDESEARSLDHLLFAVLTLHLKILRECQILRKANWAETMLPIWVHIESHLLHPHAWVRLVASQLMGFLFAAWPPKDVLQASQGAKSSTTEGYLQQDTTNKLHRLCGACVKQLASPQMEAEMADQIVKNLVYLGKVLIQMPDHQMSSAANRNSTEDGEEGNWVSLTWLIKRLVRETRAEKANNVKMTIKRSSVFKWMAAVSLELGSDRLPDYLPLLLPPLVAEIASNAADEDAELRTLCQEVVDLMKTTVGVERFTVLYAKVQKALGERKDTRKRQRAMEAVANPELAAKRRLKKNLSKKEAKKRRIEELRPTKKSKKLKTK